MSELTPRSPSIADSLISSRLLVLQSKRLMLASLERRLQKQALESLIGRADRLREETASAQEQYSSSMLKWGSPERAGYWPVAYSRLVETADRLFNKMRRAVVDIPPAAGFKASTRAKMLEVAMHSGGEDVRTIDNAAALG